MMTLPDTAARRTLLGLVTALVLIGGSTTTASGAEQVSPVGAMAPTATAAPTPIARADAALARAVTQVRRGHAARGIAALHDLRARLWRAHAYAVGLIGEPPTDPEGDDPPGPPAVLRTLALDHRVGIGLVPLFAGRTRADVVDALRAALTRAQLRRIVMLDRVIGLPPEGAGDDYTDGMSDTLGQYPSELRQLDTALTTYALTQDGVRGLTRARARVETAKVMVDGAYGGGE